MHTISITHAWAGIKWAVTTQPNFRVHFLLTAIALLGGVYFHLSYIEWVVLVFAIVLGLVAEMINTVIEAVCDLVTTEWREDIKIAKDVAAGMMLMVAIGCLLVAILIFGPKLALLL